MRVSQVGHDVPDKKLRNRFARTQDNLKRAIERLPHVLVYSNQDLAKPYQLMELYENGKKNDLDSLEPLRASGGDRFNFKELQSIALEANWMAQRRSWRELVNRKQCKNGYPPTD